MKIVCTSDTHGYHHDLKVPDGDVFIHAGDITMCGEFGVMADFNDWLKTLPHTYKIVIAGNHDKPLGDSPTLGTKIFSNAIYLQNSAVEIEGLKFWGSPITPAFGGMREGLAFYTNNKAEAKNTWKQIPKDTDVLITHGPPLHILDEVENRFNLYFDKENCGDGILAARVIEIKPKLHAFGHIHEGYGEYIASYGTHFVNCSAVNETYNIINKPIVVNI